MRAFLLLLLVALPLAAVAQPTIGVKAGLNVANLYGFEDGDLDGADKTPILGLIGGLSVELPLSPSFSVRPEVLYSEKGTKISDEITVVDVTTDVEQNVRVRYIEVPILARVAVPVSPFADAGIFLGPAPAFLVGESVTTEVDGEEVENGELEDFAKSFDTGLVLGADYASGPFGVDLRYTYGLLNINEFAEGEDGGEDGPTLRNGVFSVTGVFRLGK